MDNTAGGQVVVVTSRVGSVTAAPGHHTWRTRWVIRHAAGGNRPVPRGAAGPPTIHCNTCNAATSIRPKPDAPCIISYIGEAHPGRHYTDAQAGILSTPPHWLHPSDSRTVAQGVHETLTRKAKSVATSTKETMKHERGLHGQEEVLQCSTRPAFTSSCWAPQGGEGGWDRRAVTRL